MPSPSQLSIATSVVQRLVKEEASYHEELQQQEAHIQQLEQQGAAGDENHDYMLKQERQAAEQTKAIFPNLKDRITKALQGLEEHLAAAKEDGTDGSAEEITKAEEAIAQAKAASKQIHDTNDRQN